eukprot:SAG25_NODE_338_length_9538_cov_22.622630_7_plen_148_part_00
MGSTSRPSTPSSRTDASQSEHGGLFGEEAEASSSAAAADNAQEEEVDVECRRCGWSRGTMHSWACAVVSSRLFNRLTASVIVLNTITIAVETFRSFRARHALLLGAADVAFISCLPIYSCFGTMTPGLAAPSQPAAENIAPPPARAR